MALAMTCNVVSPKHLAGAEKLQTMRSALSNNRSLQQLRIFAPSSLRRPLSVIPQALFQRGKTDESAKEEALVAPAFTRRREVFVGRLAQVGFLSACIGEILTGRGIIGQLGLETKLPPQAIGAVLAGFVAYSFLGALNAGGTFDDKNTADIKKRPKGPLQDSSINPINNPTRFLGTSNEFGFTKKNELFVGRVAMLGFASALIGENLTGKGPLAQLGLELGTGYNPENAGIALAVWIGFFLFAAVGYNNFGQDKGGEDID